MFKQLIITATVLAASVSTAFATTIVGGAELIDTATVNPGTVSPTTYLSYVSGGNSTTGSADGGGYSILSPGLLPGPALATADPSLGPIRSRSS